MSKHSSLFFLFSDRKENFCFSEREISVSCSLGYPKYGKLTGNTHKHKQGRAWFYEHSMKHQITRFNICALLLLYVGKYKTFIILQVFVIYLRFSGGKGNLRSSRCPTGRTLDLKGELTTETNTNSRLMLTDTRIQIFIPIYTAPRDCVTRKFF